MTSIDLPVAVDDLERWLDREGVGDGPVGDLTLLAGGTQNVLLALERSGRRYVLRAPARGAGEAGRRMIEREVRLLRALDGSDVPRPALVAAALDPAPLGTCAYLMEEVDGVNPMHDLPAAVAASRDEQWALGCSMVDALVTLAAVDPRRLDAQRVDRFEGWSARQPRRWLELLRSHDEGADEPGLPPVVVDDLVAWLEAHLPPGERAGIVHGDFNFGNVLVRRDRGALAAVIDWELASVGDPLLDLGHLLVTWPLLPPASGEPHLDAPGLPDRDAVIERYAAGTGRDCADVTWYEVLAGFRLAALLEGTPARARRGLADPAVGERLHGLALHFLDRARTTASTH